MKLFKNRIGRGVPAERLGVGVVVGDELIDTLDELIDAGERASTDCLVSEGGKEAFELIESGAVGRDEMHVPAGWTGQPGLDLGVTVRGVVVDDAMNVQFDGYGLVDLTQERQELLMSVPRIARRLHRPVGTLSAANSAVVPWRL